MWVALFQSNACSHDKPPSLVIAQFLLMYRDTLAQTSITPHVSDLRDLSRQRESLLSQMTALKCDMKRLLTITFPELEKLTNVFTKSILKLVSRFPSAHAIAKADPVEINQLLIDHSMGRNSAKTTQAILQAARSSVGTTSPSRELILKQKADVVIHLEGQLKELTALMIELCRSDMGDDIDIMTSMRGIGEKTATNFLIEMGGDIQKFNDHKKLIAMAGLDPAIYQSGKHDGHGRITKRGNRHLRRVIWMIFIIKWQMPYFKCAACCRAGQVLGVLRDPPLTAHLTLSSCLEIALHPPRTSTQ